MRIALISLALLLAGCSAATGPVAQGPYADLNNANAVCLKRGLHPGTYNYDSCYENRPEVQAYERDARLSNVGIIMKNRSVYSSYQGKSYPVE